VSSGEPLATVHARGEFDADAVRACFEIADAPALRPPLIVETVDA
jgi:hypothetical protein